MALVSSYLVAAGLRRRLGFNWAVMAVVTLAGLASCATAQPEVELEPNHSVAIVVSKPPGWPVGVRVLNESVGGSSPEGLVGAGAGALAGGAWGFACGPLAALCVPLGVAAGTVVGAGAGLAVGTTAALPEEKSKQLREHVDRVLQSQDFRSLLEAEMSETAKNRWNLASDQPTVTVEVELRDVHLASTRDERIRCIVKVAVAVRPHESKQPGKQRVYEYVSPYSSLSTWLDETNGLVEATLAAAGRNLAKQIVSGGAGTR